MFNGKTIVGIITARANSKRITGKNMKLLGTKPLISWTFDAVKQSKYIDKVIVTTDSEEIIKLAKEQGIEVPFKRPKYISTDTASIAETVIHALKWLEKNDSKYDYIILFQPTSPFRNSMDIDEAIEKIVIHKKADALVSVSDFSRKTSWLKTMNTEGYLVRLINQNINPVYFPNGALYIIKSETLLQLKTFYPPKTIPYIMDATSSIDIDTEEDFKNASIVINHSYEEEN